MIAEDLKLTAGILGALFILYLGIAWIAGPEVYEYEVLRPVGGELSELRARLEHAAESVGLTSTETSTRMIGEIGCGRGAYDRTTYLTTPDVVTLHEFTCGDSWYAVIVTTQDDLGRDIGKHVKEVVESEFKTEINAGTMRARTRHRIALE